MEKYQDGTEVEENSVESLAQNMFQYLGRTFPVCCESDEFYYFPQVASEHIHWSSWDDFSPERVREVSRRLSLLESDLTSLLRKTEDLDTIIDIETLITLSRTLREQLTEVRFQETQPTFYLTVACMGLARALESKDPSVWDERVRGIPSFFKRAQDSLSEIPLLFRNMGIEMARDTSAWLKTLSKTKPGVKPALLALRSFEEFLKGSPTRDSFLMPSDLVERIVSDHILCNTGTYEVRLAIEEELEETRGIMKEEAKGILKGGSWQEALKKVPVPRIPKEGPASIYRKEIQALLRHCIDRGLVSAEHSRTNPLRVSLVPDYLRAVRAASAYSFSPGQSTQGGTFFIVPFEGPWDNNREDLVDYRMLTAHETYPGHHLLDSSRWNLTRSLRCPVESPLFYEGWACFAEELMRLTGYFSGAEDLLLLAKRRFRRAKRGLVELDLQTGKMSISSAAEHLSLSGFTKDTALSVIPKYLLRPGYQICYSIGLRRFLALFERFGMEDLPGFVGTVLAQGEVGFDNLKRIFTRDNRKIRR